MKKCLRKKCEKEFEPNKPKQVFCSAKCRVYFSRENKFQSDERDNKLVNAARGRDESGINEDELINKKIKGNMPDPKDKVAYLKWLRNTD